MANNISLFFLLCFLHFAMAYGGVCDSRVQIFGYKCEEHNVTTKDGYILSLQRIPNGRSSAQTRANKIPVLLQHGLLSDAIIWLTSSPDQSLPFILADNGFDVWISNGRGTVYSSGHTSLNPINPLYWNWSWDELVEYDLPSFLGYVYKLTGRQKIHYIGHSQGTLIGLASFSEHKLLDMTRSAALLCPIAHLNHIGSLVVLGGANAFLSQQVYWLGLGEFNPMGQAAQRLLQQLCQAPGANCNNTVTALTGLNCCISPSSYLVLQAHGPQPISTKDMIHFSQMVVTGNIAKYDYGNALENILHYRQVTPPAYNMSAIPNDLPLFFAYGGQDELSVVMDVQTLLDDLENHDKDKIKALYISAYSHLDFVMAANANQQVYGPLIDFFKGH